MWLTTQPFGDIAPVTQNGRALNFAHTPSIDAQKSSDREKGFSRKHALRILEGAQAVKVPKDFEMTTGQSNRIAWNGNPKFLETLPRNSRRLRLDKLADLPTREAYRS